MRIDKPGLYEISETDYHADPCFEPSFSASIGKEMLARSPRHAWTKHPRLNPDWQPDNRAMFDLGKAAHALLLGEARDFAVIDAEDWRTKAAKEERDLAYAAGLTPLLAGQWAQVQEMAMAARAQLAVHEDAKDAFTYGKPDMTLVWQEGDTWCRSRLDWLPNKGRKFPEFKSTGESAHPDAWTRQLFNLGYDFQSALYRRGIRAVLGIEDPIFEFIVQETEPPYALSVIGLPPAVLDMAERKVDAALEWWRWCLESDTWPGYPRKTCYVDMPAYIEAQWLEREAREAQMREKGNEALFKLAMSWQQPLPVPFPEVLK